MTLSGTKSCLSNLQSIIQMTVLFLVLGVPEFSYAVKDHLFSGRQFIWTILETLFKKKKNKQVKKIVP